MLIVTGYRVVLARRGLLLTGEAGGNSHQVRRLTLAQLNSFAAIDL